MILYVLVNPFISFTDNLQVITYAARTPLTKAKKGGLKDTQIDDLLISLLTVSNTSQVFYISQTNTSQTVRENMNIDPSLIEDICLGNVLAPSQGYVVRSSVSFLFSFSF